MIIWHHWLHCFPQEIHINSVHLFTSNASINPRQFCLLNKKRETSLSCSIHPARWTSFTICRWNNEENVLGTLIQELSTWWGCALRACCRSSRNNSDYQESKKRAFSHLCKLTVSKAPMLQQPFVVRNVLSLSVFVMFNRKSPAHLIIHLFLQNLELPWKF